MSKSAELGSGVPFWPMPTAPLVVMQIPDWITVHQHHHTVGFIGLRLNVFGGSKLGVRLKGS